MPQQFFLQVNHTMPIKKLFHKPPLPPEIMGEWIIKDLAKITRKSQKQVKKLFEPQTPYSLNSQLKGLGFQPTNQHPDLFEHSDTSSYQLFVPGLSDQLVSRRNQQQPDVFCFAGPNSLNLTEAHQELLKFSRY